MKLEDIGFYTLSDTRAATASATSPLTRCELLLTSRCNFRCPYCRHVGGRDLPYEEAGATVRLWAFHNLQNIRFSGGEPTLYPRLPELVRLSRDLGINRIAVYTNGSAEKALYQELLDSGVNDFSVSLDACCAEDGDAMAGGVKGAWVTVVENIRWLASKTYTTVGVVLTEDNSQHIEDTIRFASSLGVADVRVIPAAQCGNRLSEISVAPEILEAHPILKYRTEQHRPVRGLGPKDSHRCGLVLDDIAACAGEHYACIIHMRESGKAIGKIGPSMRMQRLVWFLGHDTHTDPICQKNCLDVCVDYNNRFAETNRLGKEEPQY